jgi:hypothetical protein
MALAMMQNKSSNPIGIGLFGAQTVVLQTDLPTHLIEQPGL